MSLPGLLTDIGVVQVTATSPSASPAQRCVVFGRTANAIQVRCLNGAGVATDAAFVLSVVR